MPAITNAKISSWLQNHRRGTRSRLSSRTMEEPISPALRAVSDAVLSVAAELSVDEVLQRLVDNARELVGARYAALGIPDEAGGFRSFLVSGMSDGLVARLGPLPRTHGMLGAMLQSTGGRAYIATDIHEDPRFEGDWPRAHPDMRSFLGVPIVARDEVIGAFYLTERRDRSDFGDGDRALIELLAAHAAIAITNARLYERSRELSVLAERNRLALELHDVVSQKLFGLHLAAETAATLLDRDVPAARHQLHRVRELAQESLGELRSLMLGLRPADLTRDGLAGALGEEVAMLRRVHGIDVRLHPDPDHAPGESHRRDGEVLRIALEALHNAVRHAAARRVRVSLGGGPAGLRLQVSDDGLGFDPADPELRARHLGLTSMEERAAELGGRLEIRSSPAGTTVTLTVDGD